MSFAARGLIVSLAFFAVLYSMLSLLVVLAWRGLEPVGSKLRWSSANFRFGLRLFPFAASLVATLFFTIPSFWLLERTTLDEDLETFVLALCALLILGAGLFRVLRAQARTTRAVAQWLIGTPSLGGDARMPTLRASHGAPPLILVGFRKPRVMISDLATTVLSDDELQVAVRHELRHARSWDNLKKAVVSSTPFPGMSSLESAWQEAAELAADDTAVTNRQEALNLAAALIKLSRSSRQSPESVLATALVSGSSSISVRVDRLLRWRMAGRRFQRTWPWTLLVLLTMIVGIAGNYGAALVLTHRLTELLVP
jgi:beta-lactamase regulating signal transducer with metallopeptidase domain